MSKIEELIRKLCPDGVELRPLYKLTIWDKRFNGINKSWQANTMKFKHVSAAHLKSISIQGGDVKLLSTGNYLGWTTEKIAGKNLNEGEVITIPSGGTANLKYYNGKFVDSGNILAVANDDSVNLKYVYYFLLDNNNLINSFYRGAGVKHPNMFEVLQILIPIPPLPIQQEIVSILDNFTSLEAELEAELEARTRQYEFYRNQLLTPIVVSGKWLMNGEEVEWKTLGEVGKFIRGNGLQKKDFTETGVGCIHYGQIYTLYGTFTATTKSFVSEQLAKKLRKAQTGDLIIATTSENVEDVCKTVVWLGEEDICISGETYILKHNQNPKYLAYYLQTPMFFNYKRQHITGTKVIRLHGDKLAKYKLPIPSLSEQERIVSILDKFDALVNDISIGLPAEITARRQQYEFYRQRLLTFKSVVSG